MELADLLAPAKAGRKYDKVEAALDGLTEEERVVVLNALRDPLFTNGQIAAALNTKGHELNDGHVQYYRTKLRRGEVG